METESLIFDIDGTLWDTRSIYETGYNTALRRAGYPELCVTIEQLKALFGKTQTEIADLLLATVPQQTRYNLMAECIAEGDALLANARISGYPGVRKTLTALSHRHRLFIVSNSQQGYPELVMNRLGLTGLFSGHLCYGDTGTDKGTTIRTLMTRYAIHSAAYIGDTQGDYEATVTAGIPFVWAAYGFGTPAHYDAKADCFTELTTIF